MSDNDPIRPMTRRIWLLWVFSQAMTAVLLFACAVMLFRSFGQEGGLRRAFVSALPAIILITAVTPVFIQWFVLRLLVPRLTVLWVLACMVSTVIGVYVGQSWADYGLSANRALFGYSGAWRYDFGALMGLPWHLVVAEAAILALIYNGFPALVLGWAAGRRWTAFLVLAVLGACVAAILTKLLGNDFDPAFSDLMSTANHSWWSIATDCFALTVGPVVQAVISGYGLVRMFPAPSSTRTDGPPTNLHLGRRLAIQVYAAAAAWILVVFSILYLDGPNGLRNGLPQISRIFSPAPASDQSTGVPILTYSHEVPLAGNSWLMSWSPDGMVLLAGTGMWRDPDTERAVWRIDPASRRIVGDPILEGQRFRSIRWDPTGRYIAVNQAGGSRGAGQHDSGQIRLFSSDGFTVLETYAADIGPCPLGRIMEFVPDGRALWIACERSASSPDSWLAVKLSVPGFDLLAHRTYRLSETSARISASSSSIRMIADDALLLLLESRGEVRRIRLLNLTTDQEIWTSSNVRDQALGGPGYCFGGLRLSPDAMRVTINTCQIHYRALHEATGLEVAREYHPYRVFDVTTGNLVARYGHFENPDDPVTWSIAYDELRQLVIGVGRSRGSDVGHLAVWDRRTGEELQRIRTRIYRGLSLSPTGNWLAVLAEDRRALHFYRIAG